MFVRSQEIHLNAYSTVHEHEHDYLAYRIK